MIADVPGSMLSPISLRSSSLKPLSRTFPQIAPAPPPIAALAIRLGGKDRAASPPAAARAAAGPALRAGIAGLLGSDLSVRAPNDDRGVDHLDRALLLHLLEV